MLSVEEMKRLTEEGIAVAVKMGPDEKIARMSTMDQSDLIVLFFWTRDDARAFAREVTILANTLEG